MRQFIFYRGILLIVVLFVTTILESGCKEQPIAEKHITVVFRFDDYSAFSSGNIETKVIDAFQKNGVPMTVGVIPRHGYRDADNTNASDKGSMGATKWHILRSAVEAGIIEVALHGYSHTGHYGEDGKIMGEFKNLDYSGASIRIAKGKHLIESMMGSPITIFIPPWNQYNLNTLRALEDLKFSTISADMFGEAREDSLIKFAPAKCGLLELKDAVKAVRNSHDTQPLIVVLFHPQDFKEINAERGLITYQDLTHHLEWLKSQGDVRLLSITQATAAIDDLSATRFLSNKRIESALKLLPSFLRLKGTNLYYQSANVLLKVWLRIGLFYLAIVIVVGLVFLILGYFFFPMSRLISNIAKYGIPTTSIVILIYVLHDLKIHYVGMTGISAAVGACIGTSLFFLYFSKKTL